MNRMRFTDAAAKATGVRKAKPSRSVFTILATEDYEALKRQADHMDKSLSAMVAVYVVAGLARDNVSIAVAVKEERVPWPPATI
jgi:hypothetical protein